MCADIVFVFCDFCWDRFCRDNFKYIFVFHSERLEVRGLLKYL